MYTNGLRPLTYTTQAEVRASFWATYPQEQALYYLAKKPQNDYPADLRMAFVDYVDDLARNGDISEKLAQRVTL